MTNLIQELKQFTGSDIVYRNPLFGKFVYTEGVKHLAEKAEVTCPEIGLHRM